MDILSLVIRIFCSHPLYERYWRAIQIPSFSSVEAATAFIVARYCTHSSVVRSPLAVTLLNMKLGLRLSAAKSVASIFGFLNSSGLPII